MRREGHQTNVAEPDLPRILLYKSIRGGERLEYVFQHYLVPVRAAVAPLVERLGLVIPPGA